MTEPEMPAEKDLRKLCELAEEVMEALCTAEESWNYISIARDRDFRRNGLPELEEMPVGDIKNKYLSGFLPKARDALRKDMDPGSALPDSLLDEIFTLTWLGKVRWWASLCEFVEKHEEGEDVP